MSVCLAGFRGLVGLARGLPRHFSGASHAFGNDGAAYWRGAIVIARRFVFKFRDGFNFRGHRINRRTGIFSAGLLFYLSI